MRRAKSAAKMLGADDLVPAKQFAALVGLSVETVEKRCQAGKLSAVTLPCGCLAVDRAELAKFEAALANRPTEPTITPAEYARHMRLNVKTVHGHLAAGHLRGWRDQRGRWSIPRSALDAIWVKPSA